MPRLKQKQTHSRQRQRLIDACISALHIYGPSRTTVEKVVAIAKLSPGIVRFYFASKAAMLVASLQFLATEFDEQVLAPVSRLKDKPVAALRLLVQLYLDPHSPVPARYQSGMHFGVRRVHARNTTIFADKRTRASRRWCARSSNA